MKYFLSHPVKLFCSVILLFCWQSMLLAQTDQNQFNNPLIVKTKYGFVKGKKDKNNTIVWKGIPFAKPPIGDLRWKAPQNPDAWEDIKVCTKFSNHALQFKPGSKHRITGNEDCLYLNIWRPDDNTKELPVFVWIHGGGNTMGYANQIPEYYGDSFAAKNKMVFVSVNYRLGPFGWLTHPSLRNSSNQADNSGNYGTLDIIHALEWIKDNIESFGGNPDKVMIAGESAGGINVLSLLISPRASGLFSSALSESGIPITSSMQESELFAEKILLNLLMNQNKAKNDDEAETLLNNMSNNEISDLLYKQKGKDIFKALSPYMLGMIDMPFILRDGYIIPETGYDVLESGSNLNKVPLMIGSNTDEMKAFLFFAKEPRFKDSLYHTIAKYGSEMWKAKGVDDVARKLSALPGQPPIYVYLFNWGTPNSKGESPLIGNYGERLGAHHMAEIKFFLATEDKKGSFLNILDKSKYNSGRKNLSDYIQESVKSFIITGNPNNNRYKDICWEPWNNDKQVKGIVLDADKDNILIKNLSYELFPDSVKINMNRNINDNQSETVNYFMFIFP